MINRTARAWAGLLAVLLIACSGGWEPGGERHGEGTSLEPKGPNGGRLLVSGDLSLELTIFERGLPPEFRVWATKDGEALDPGDIELSIELTRLGGRVDRISFLPQGDFLRGESVIYEPHSFAVSIEAVHEGKKHTWEYDNFEGRTRIEAAVADALGVRTAIAGEVTLVNSVRVYGRIRVDPKRVREIRARFDGMVREVHPDVGTSVRKGDRLLTVESDESLKTYTISAPIGGVVTQRDANPGEHTSGRLLLTITDTSSVRADLAVFPGDRALVRVGNPVAIALATGGSPVSGVISTLEVLARDDQSVVAQIFLENPDGELPPGSFVVADVTVGEHSVPVAVEKVGLQAFRDFTVVYAQVGEEYEVRMLELGRDATDYVEVLSGLDPGTRYVTENSYLIKADIEKSGATHDH